MSRILIRSADEFQSIIFSKRHRKRIPVLVRSACAAATRIVRADIFAGRLSSLLTQLLHHELYWVCNIYCSKLFSRWWGNLKKYLLSLSAIYSNLQTWVQTPPLFVVLKHMQRILDHLHAKSPFIYLFTYAPYVTIYLKSWFSWFSAIILILAYVIMSDRFLCVLGSIPFCPCSKF